jgi:uridylate kinase
MYEEFVRRGVYPADRNPEVHGYLEDLAYVLDSGIKVALVYGDGDYACNWIGGKKSCHAAGPGRQCTRSSCAEACIQQTGIQKHQHVGDYPRSDVHGYLEDLAYVLDSGIKVALVYGDGDLVQPT